MKINKIRRNTKAVIYLADLVHAWNKKSMWTMPLGVAYISSYAKKIYGDDVHIELFKDPSDLIKAINKQKPDILGMAYYVWNINLNSSILKMISEKELNIFTIGGGPVFTDLNAKEDVFRGFFNKQKSLDMYILNQGEITFSNVIGKFIECQKNKYCFVLNPIDNTFFNNDGHVIAGDIVNPTFSDLDDIPSPYTSGMLDKFIDNGYVPMIETNRSCPFRCTFCAWGIGSGKLLKFSMERIESDVEYIANNNSKSTTMMIADANFGLLDRDSEIAQFISNQNKQTGFPNYVSVWWSKTRPDKVSKTVKAFDGISDILASVQSLDESVLKAIKRKNLTLEQIQSMNDLVPKQSNKSSTLTSELIIGLPLETMQSNLSANRTLIDMNMAVVNYNLHLIPGTEMDGEKDRGNYFEKTGWRLHDNAYGVYDGKRIFEGQEVVIQTSTMSEGDMREIRFIHFLIHCMWNQKWYFNSLMFIKNIGINPVDIALSINNLIKDPTSNLYSLYRDFYDDYATEVFSSEEELYEFWGNDKNFTRLSSGDYGKLNFKFTFEVVFKYSNNFKDILLNATKVLIHKDIAYKSNTEKNINILSDIIDYDQSTHLKLKNNSLVVKHSRKFNYSILNWVEDGYVGIDIIKARNIYKFYMNPDEVKNMNMQIDQYSHDNTNATFRKMSEYTKSSLFFYNVELSTENDI